MGVGRKEAMDMVHDLISAEPRFNGVEVVLAVNEVPEGWQIIVHPANSYLRRHRRDLKLWLFVDHLNGQIHHVPSSGLRGLIIRLRSQ